MSDASPQPRRALHLILEGFPAGELDELAKVGDAEILPLTEATARQALERIFATDTVAVWTKIDAT
jgi:hypothetical protein